MRSFYLIVVSYLIFVPIALHAQDVPQSQEQIRLSFAPVSKKASPAVVNIYTKGRVKVRQNASPFANGPFFQQFFGNEFAFGGRTQEKVVSSLGSGVITSADGVIVTSHHVIKQAEQISVVLSDGREFEAKVIVRDPQTDLAVLKITADTPLPFIELRDSDQIEVGDLVLTIGNPFGVGQTVTQGIVSAVARKAKGVSDYAFFIQTDAAINPGNSGGALIGLDGKLIGINTAIYSTTGASNGIGFAIPANMVRVVLGGVNKNGVVSRPWLGASVQKVTPEIAQSLGMSTAQGVIITSVTEGSSAYKAGLKAGDVIMQVGSEPIVDDQALQYRTALAAVGEAVAFTLWRNGAKQDITVTMLAPVENPKRDVRQFKGNHPLAGVTVVNLSPAVLAELGVLNSDAKGVMVLSAESGIFGVSWQAGDIIRAVNGVEITSTAQLASVLQNLMKEKTRGWTIVYDRGTNRMTLTIRK